MLVRTVVVDVADKLVAALHEVAPSANASEIAQILAFSVGNSECDLDAIISRLNAGSATDIAAASILSDAMSERVVHAIREGTWLELRRFDDQLERTGARLALRQKPTYFVRDRLNPLLEQSVLALEVARGPLEQRLNALHRSAAILALGLSIAKYATSVSDTLRGGLSADYVHWFGRVARASGALSTRGDELCSPALVVAAVLIQDLRSLMQPVEDAVQIILSDDHIPESIRSTFNGT